MLSISSVFLNPKVIAKMTTERIDLEQKQLQNRDRGCQAFLLLLFNLWAK
jgi:hypothetical protein